MNSFSVAYVGQLRFIECIDTHVQHFKDSYVYASVTPNIVESWNLKLYARHSVYPDKQLAHSIEEFTSNPLIKEHVILTDDDYAGYPMSSNIEFFPCNYFFTFATTCRSIDTDFIFLVTTDLLFFKDSNIFQECVDKHNITSVPTVYAIASEPNCIATAIVLLNSAAVECVKKNWKYALDTFLKEDHKYKLKNEYATYRLFQLCGIDNFEKLSLSSHIIRFRANMDFKNLDFYTCNTLTKEYSVVKATKVNERWLKLK